MSSSSSATISIDRNVTVMQKAAPLSKPPLLIDNMVGMIDQELQKSESINAELIHLKSKMAQLHSKTAHVIELNKKLEVIYMYIYIGSATLLPTKK